ncbi:MAG TPA: hypothetical protein VGQ45_00930 [Gaiellales bacterium]|nr:hypothetical protein [Gaiellales bacterium]
MTAPRREDQHGNQGDADDQRAEGVHQVAKGETLPLPIVFRHLPIVRIAKSDTRIDISGGWELRQSFPRLRGVIGITRGPAVVASAVLVVVGLLTGCGSATSADTSCVGVGCRPIAVVVASSVIHDGGTRIVGGTGAQRALLHTILEGISSRDVPEVTVGPPPGTSLMGGGGTWLIFHFPGDENRSQLGEWESWLVAGAFRDLSAARGLPAVRGDGVVFHPDVGSGYERLCCAAHHVTSAASRQTLTRRITEGIKRAGLTLISIRFAKPFHLAPIVIAKTSDPDAKLGSWMPKSSPYGDDSNFEGAFLEVRNRAGRVVFFVGHSTRTQTGIGSIGLSGPAPTS